MFICNSFWDLYNKPTATVMLPRVSVSIFFYIALLEAAEGQGPTAVWSHGMHRGGGCVMHRWAPNRALNHLFQKYWMHYGADPPLPGPAWVYSPTHTLRGAFLPAQGHVQAVQEIFNIAFFQTRNYCSLTSLPHCAIVQLHIKSIMVRSRTQL